MFGQLLTVTCTPCVKSRWKKYKLKKHPSKHLHPCEWLECHGWILIQRHNWPHIIDQSSLQHSLTKTKETLNLCTKN